MDTKPMPLDALAAQHGGLDAFRLESSAEVQAMLKLIFDANAAINLNGSDGSSVVAHLWTVDTHRQALSLTTEPDDVQLQSLLECSEAVAVTYLENVKLQFDVDRLVLVQGPSGSALRCDLPLVIYRFQRRNSFRVRPMVRQTPTATLRHPSIPDMQLSLRLLNVSLGGCALFLPDNVPPIAPGVLMNHVFFELDVETRFTAHVRLHHITAITHDAQGSKLGCELVNLSRAAERDLQHYIEQSQKQRRMLSLDP